MEQLDVIRQLISLRLRDELCDQIYDSLQGQKVEAILRKANFPQTDNYYKNILDGHSFKVDQNNLPNYYRIFREVCETVGFREPVDFYITGDSSINAFCVPSRSKDRAHILNVNSGLINIMTDEELCFVIGHEFGHLIDQSLHVKELINFVYPNGASTPLALVNKIRIWNQLNELSADRCGFIACRDLAVCVSAFFKMSSGLDFHKMGLNFETFIEDNSRKLLEFSESGGLNISSHPTNLIRIEALKIFSCCSVFYEEGGVSFEELEAHIDPLMGILVRLSDNKIDYYIAQYAACLGIMLSSIDGELDRTEINTILNNLAGVYVFPRNYIQVISEKSGTELGKMLDDTLQYIIQEHPEMRAAMLNYAIQLVLADNEINDKELDFVFDLGTRSFGFNEQEVAQMFAEAIQASFTPDVWSIS